ncbi:hypothetical protein ASG65_00895 [Bacillus sp. Leaf13]|nr:hypothetical protein ASG65_00895 [Bacillus sp. Leaf13]KRF65506.1 hypothetical protein ASG99_18635 [Bacillus sp. Soil768D1]
MDSEHNKSIGRLISLLNKYGNIYMNEKLKNYNLGAGQYQFLMVLYQNEGLSQDEVANILKMDKGTTARAIAKLESEGYVERKVFNTDKRVKKLYLTIKAHEFEKEIRSILTNWKMVLANGLSTEEQNIALALLNQIALNAEEYLDCKH